MVGAILGTTLIDLSELLDSPVERTSQILTTRAIGFLVGSLLSSSVLYRYIHGKICMVYTLVLGGVVNALIPSLGTLAGAHMCLFFAGMSAGILEVGGNVWLEQLWLESVAPVFQMYHLSFAFGSFVAPVITEPYLSTKKETPAVSGTEGDISDTWIAIPYAIFGTFYSLVGFFMLFLFCIDPSDLHGNQPAPTGETTNIEKTKQRAQFEWRIAVHLVLYIFVQVSVEHTIGQMLNVYVLSHVTLGFDKWSASYLFATFWTLYTAGRVVAMVLSFKVRSFTLILFMHSLCIIGTILIVTLGTTVGSSLWVSIGIMGFGLSPLYASAMSWAVRYTRLQYIHMTFVLVASCMGQMLPPLTVALWVKATPSIFVWVIFGWMVLHTINLFLMHKVTKGQVDIYEYESASTEPTMGVATSAAGSTSESNPDEASA
ncbi:sodium-dependent glucose transporter 1-like [Tropilaelaps mercedesae]|uniref:Sodium-dependent glucose transporter 1-like n=1 Tax=Tropilaelaps mercedesae TaxID=418985 RepID=A0A1V9XFC1_9ACAR|nr:sodium-dependent glucose transporter 1-like [Tropilaelaps mercedesae]